MTNILPASMTEAGCQVFSMETSDADKHRSIIGAAQSLSALKSRAEMESNLLAFADAVYRASLLETVDVDGCPAGQVDGTHLADVLEQARMQAFAALAGTGYHRAKGIHRVMPEKQPGKQIGVIFPSGSARMAEAEKVYNSTTGAQYVSRMPQDAELNGNPARYAVGQHRASQISRAEAGKDVAAAAAAAAASESISKTELKKNLHAAAVGEYAAESTGWAMPEIRPNMEVSGPYLADILMALEADANPVRDVAAQETIASETAAEPESLPPLAVKAKKAASTNTQADAEADQILMTEAQHTGQTAQSSGAEAILALFTGASKVAATRSWTGIEKLENLQVTVSASSGIRKLAQPVSNTSAQVAAKHRSGSSVRCALDVMIPESAWYDPVQRGSDLYIRSAYSSWTDGSKLNIDTAFFLEPVQEGSNLHIRMDIFGGE